MVTSTTAVERGQWKAIARHTLSSRQACRRACGQACGQAEWWVAHNQCNRHNQAQNARIAAAHGRRSGSMAARPGPRPSENEPNQMPATRMNWVASASRSIQPASSKQRSSQPLTLHSNAKSQPLQQRLRYLLVDPAPQPAHKNGASCQQPLSCACPDAAVVPQKHGSKARLWPHRQLCSSPCSAAAVRPSALSEQSRRHYLPIELRRVRLRGCRWGFQGTLVRRREEAHNAPVFKLLKPPARHHSRHFQAGRGAGMDGTLGRRWKCNCWLRRSSQQACWVRCDGVPPRLLRL